MKHLKSIDHIGYAVRDIASTAAYYTAAGWQLSEVFEERVQNTRIAFLRKEGFTTIELVSPLEGKSPVDNILKQVGCSTYHVCYVVDDIEQAVEDLYEEDFKPLFFPVESVAMENRKICYLYNMQVGLIELVEAEADRQ
ncbi:MAG: VOC family protein [Bacteroidales bacterium]|nr:VOC family protein [Bacteroidales bacterium]